MTSTIKWFDNTVEPRNGALVLINTDITNIFEDDCGDDIPDIEHLSLPGQVLGDGHGGIVISIWNGDYEATLRFDDILYWAYLPEFK